MAYTANKKPSGLNPATTPLAGANEIVLSQAGTVVRASLNQVESKVFDAKTQVTPVNGDVVVVRRGSDIRQMVVENMIPNGAIANAQISATAGITDGKLAQITSANKVANSATTATNANTVNAIVARDGSGNFSAGTITASLSGTATSAAALTPGATIGITGDVTYTSPTFTGAANVTAAATINTDAVTTAKIINSAVTAAKIADDAVTFAKMQNSAAAGLSVVGRNTNSAGDFAEINAGTDGHVLRRSGSSVGFGQIATAGIADGAVTTAKMAFTPVQQGGGIDQGNNKIYIGWRNTGPATLRLQVDSQDMEDDWPINVTGNAATANAWTTPRNLSLTGDVTATLANVSGAGAVSAAATLANSGVAAGTYNNSESSVRPFTVDAKGRITSIGTNVPIAIDYSAVSGMAFKKDVRLATTGNLAATYANGSSGVGATLTGTSVGALGIESITVGLNNRLLVKNQTAAIQNGIYTVTQVGSVSLPFILTRADDADTNDDTGGAVVAVEQGGQNGGKLFTTDFKISSVVGTNDQNWYQVVTTGDSATVATAMLADSSVTAAKIANSNVTTAKIADANVTTAKIADANVTTAKLATETQQALIPVGAVMSFAGSTAPVGWLICNGDALPTSGSRQGVSHTLLAPLRNFLLANSSPFGISDPNPRIPDLQGVFVRGSGSRTIGVNTYTATLGAAQTDQLRSHSHTLSTSNSGASNSGATDPVRSSAGGTPNTRGGVGATNLVLEDDDTQGSYSIGYSGGPETRPANVALLYCIKY